jgi:membrane protease subunit HflK
MNNIRDIQDIREHLPKMPDPKKLVTGVGGFIGLLLLVFLILTAAYTVKAESVGVVLRFGKYIKTVEPGLHFKIPFGVDRVYKVPVRQIRKQEFGYRTKEAGVRTQYEPGKRYEEETLMLTGDLNIAEVQWAVQYQISDSYQYLFKNRNPEEALRDVSEAVMRSIVGDYTADEVLTQGRAEVSVKVHEQMQEILDSYETGIQLVTVKLQDVHPPDPVKPSFNEVGDVQQGNSESSGKGQSGRRRSRRLRHRPRQPRPRRRREIYLHPRRIPQGARRHAPPHVRGNDVPDPAARRRRLRD